MTEQVANYNSFRECLATLVIDQLSPAPSKLPRKKRANRSGRKRLNSNSTNNDVDIALTANVQPTSDNEEQKTSDAEELADFIEYLAEEIFDVLPPDLRTLDYAAIRNDNDLAARYSVPLPQSTLDHITALIPAPTLDSLGAYALIPPLADPTDVQKLFVEPLLTAYTSAATAAPANLGPDFGPRATACEICARDWIPLTYHHLIPRGVHAKVLKRGWHEDWRLNSVAWLCRACHSMVHRVASNEELAREWYSVELLLERDDVRGFAAWVGGVRWKKR